MTGETRKGVQWSVIGGGVFAALLIGGLTMNFATPRMPAPDEIDPTTAADSLVGLWIDSLGGMETYEQFEAASFTVATMLYDTLSGRLKRNRPRYAWVKKGPHGEETRVERWETHGFIEQGFNGLTSWARLEGEMLPDSAKDAREALYVARDLFYWTGLPFKLRDPGVILTYRGLMSRPGAELRHHPSEEMTHPPENAYHAVGVSFEAGVGEHQDVFTYYFTPGRAFPVEATYVEEGRTSLNRFMWGETGRAGELQYPYLMRRSWMTESGKITKALEIQDFVVNPELPQSMFEEPGT